MGRPQKRIPCPECGSTSRHKSGCSKPERSAPARLEPAQESAEPYRLPTGSLQDLDVEQLLDLRVQLVHEMVRRQKEAAATAERIADALLLRDDAKASAA